jgi:putative Mn2+ efflux pump MntP
MSLFSIFLLALALAADSFAASIAKGVQLYRPTLKQALFVGVLFGGFQALMPLIGWQIGIELQPIIEAIDHWLAFGILSAVGVKMIYEGLHSDADNYDRRALTISALILTAIATSIDSFVVGFGFGFLNVSVLIALTMIGGVTFLTSVGGVYLGKKFGEHFGEYVEIIAGIMLIGIGFKILLDHLAY